MVRVEVLLDHGSRVRTPPCGWTSAAERACQQALPRYLTGEIDLNHALDTVAAGCGMCGMCSTSDRRRHSAPDAPRHRHVGHIVTALLLPLDKHSHRSNSSGESGHDTVRNTEGTKQTLYI
jgi:hypothetical protein